MLTAAIFTSGVFTVFSKCFVCSFVFFNYFGPVISDINLNPDTDVNLEH